MKFPRWLAFAAILFLSSCQSTTSPTITIIDNDKVITLQADERVPLALLNQAGLTLNPNDHILLNGVPVAREQVIDNFPLTLQVRRAVNVLIMTPDGQQTIQTSAFTIGEALTEARIPVHAGDRITPPVISYIVNSLTVNYIPAHELTVS